MTTTLRPTGPLQQTADGGKSRSYEVCVNSRPVGALDIATDAAFGHRAGILQGLRVAEPDRRRGRATVAVLAAEEVLRDWGCEQALASVEPGASGATRLLASLGYTERSRTMDKELAPEPPSLPEGVEARPMSDAEYATWLADGIDAFAREWIDRGTPPGTARAKSERSHRENLPDGLATPGVTFRVLVHDGSAVGHLWVSRHEVRPGRWGSYVYDVAVTEEMRGRGFGRALMLLAEQVAHASGSDLLGLHVFTDNTPAVRLYESLRYVTVHRNFVKRLL
ncbi:GNAT family N-acetyltransferase [Streptomyces corynorhini]|uniref:GNAT family N-acetyltransferase n=1 Tax=Streptomyces corynorhini TaxID=2282652 RepID=A0A370BGJ5_9ACTN|nr:GNAT family N-acetyltransferase [Streptomyces corynorhini]RDG38535.1 GNAT family N-acetyltransferase [Streptomyces corynorhini]